VIAVSALVTKTCWTPRGGTSTCYEEPPVTGTLAPFSSIGPTRDGRLKPEVCAPGMGVVSALSASMAPSIRTRNNLPRYLDPDGVHWLAAGTSMAAPHVTGAVALLLERVPDLTPDAVRARLLNTGPIVPSPDGTWAGRRLDVSALVAETAVLSGFFADPVAGGRVRVSWRASALMNGASFHLERSVGESERWDRLGGTERTGRGPHLFEDGPLEPGRLFHYRLLVTDPYGVTEMLGDAAVLIPGEASLVLRPPRVNPGPPPVGLSFYIPPAAIPVAWHLDIFDLGGRRVRRLAEGELSGQSGDVFLEWDGTSDSGRALSAGVYFVRLDSGAGVRTTKLVLMR
jgi:hypothetical protein